VARSNNEGMSIFVNRGGDKSLARPGRKQATATEEFEFHMLFKIIIGGKYIYYLYIQQD
jgi:hypothetical protein